MVKTVTKYAVTVEDPASIRYHLEKALHLARTGRPGPVWIDIPLDVQAAPVDPERLDPFVPERQASRSNLRRDAATIGAMIESAERPLILAGHGVRLAGAAAEFKALAERMGVPVATTWNALDLLDYDHPLCAGRPGVVAQRSANFAVQSCDLLISIGARLDNVVTAYAPRNFAPRARKVVVDVDEHEIAKLDMDIELSVCADARGFVAELASVLPTQPPPDRSEWLDRIASWKRRYPVRDGAKAPMGPEIGHYEFVDELSAALPPDTLIATGSSGLAVEAFYSAFRNKPGQRVFLTSGLGAMGYGLAAAIGACLASGRRPMVAVESDGSLMLNLQELATLKALQLPIVLFVMNNNGYASIRNTQRNYFDGRFIGTGPEARLWMPDFQHMAEAFGMTSLRIDSRIDLRAGLREALELSRPCLCEIRLVENETLAPKVSAIPRPDGSMISMPLEDMSPMLPLEVLRQELGFVSSASIAARHGDPV
jgi:acetolactate synthase-1/2/3 large subunit